MTTRSSRRSSISLTRVSTDSWPYWSPPAAPPGQAVRLVDEQHAPRCRRDDLGRLGRGLAEVAGDELGAVDLDQVAPRQQPQGPVDAADQPGHRRLAGARVAGEHQVPGHRGALQAGIHPQLLDPQQGDLPVDLALDPLQPDEGVELGEQLLEALRRVARSAPAAGPGAPLGPRRPQARPPSRSSTVARADAEPAPTAAGGRVGPHGGQLGGGRDRRVADDAHGRLAELAGSRGDLGQGLGVGRRVRGPLGRQRGEGRRGRLRQRRPRLAASKKSWVVAPPTASSPVGRRPPARTPPRPPRGPVPPARANAASLPAAVATLATVSTASARVAVPGVTVPGGAGGTTRVDGGCDGAHQASRPAGG